MDLDTKTKYKLRCVLSELLKSDYKVTDDTILEKLITHLSDKDKASKIIDVPLCLSWVHSVILSWLQGKTSAAVVSFAMRLVGIIVQDETNFMNLQKAVPQEEVLDPVGIPNPVSNDSMLHLMQEMCLATAKSTSNFSVKCALIQLLASLLNHLSGRRWILITALWKEVYQMSLTDSSVYVVREARKFFSKLLNEMPSTEEKDVETVLSYVLEPFFSIPSATEFTPDNAKVTATLHLTLHILENSFLTMDPETLKISSPVSRVISKPPVSLLPKSLEALKATKSEEMMELLSKIAVLIHILNIIKEGKKNEPHEMKSICLEILGVFNELINKGSVENVLKLCVLCHNNWIHVAKVQRRCNEPGINNALVSKAEEKKYRFEDQLLCLQLTPLCVGCTMGDSTLESDFQIKTSQRLEQNVMRSIYTLRDYVAKNRHLMDKTALQSVTSICSLSVSDIDPEDERERAVLVFQSFIYVLKHFVLCAESETKQGGWGGEFRQSHHSTLLVAILDGLANLVRSHRITWRESVESLCLFTLAQELLDSPTFSSKVGLVVQALNLIQLCIENFMPPNLALLTNNMSGTSLDQLGPLIYKRLHDPHWEVRDSSLEVLITLATISHTKYPLFQELILDNKLCEVVVHLAHNDAESYVCATATKCLTAMVRVDRLWNEELCDKDLVNKMIGILNGESEGVLRREASLLMSQIFKHRKVQPDVLQKMCLTMANVVLADLHWEVKVNALSFWELIIEHHMNNQGMIDGVFPQVTFSKEHRKIITLTPSAILEQLKKVLGELAQNGCLHVLLQSIRYDEDLEVVKKSAQILKSLSIVLERYDFLNPKSIIMPSNSTGSPPAGNRGSSSNSNHVLPSSDCSEHLSKSSSPSSVVGTAKPNAVDSDISNSHFNSLNSNDCSEPMGKSILDLDPQGMGFAVLDDDELHLPSEMQDKVIDSILSDRDINLLAKVYLGTGAEMPGRQGPETKVSKPLHPLKILSSDDFLLELSTLQVDKIVEDRARWIEDTGGNLDTLLDDMLIRREINFEADEDDCNAMDCY